MSRLAQALHHQQTGERLHIPRPIRSLSVAESYDRSSIVAGNYGVQYKISATFECKVVVQEDRRSEELGHAVAHARQRIAREVFGEYVPPLHDVIHHLCNYEIDEARRLLEKIIGNFDASIPFDGKGD